MTLWQNDDTRAPKQLHGSYKGDRYEAVDDRAKVSFL